FQAIAPKWLALDLLRHVTGIVVFTVPGKPQDGSHDQLRRTSCARAFDCAADYLEARAEIRSINTAAFKAITDCAINKIVARELAVVRSGISIMIICRDYHQRHLFYCRDIHSLVKRPGLHPAFADARQADKVFLSLRAFRHQRADSDRNHRTEMANHGELVVLRAAPMDVAVASAPRTLARAYIW